MHSKNSNTKFFSYVSFIKPEILKEFIKYQTKRTDFSSLRVELTQKLVNSYFEILSVTL